MKRPAILVLAGAVLLSVALPLRAHSDSWFNFGRNVERGSGDIVTEEREIEAFERIRLAGSADLVITVGPQPKVTVTTDDNLLDNVVTEVISRRTLLVDSDGSYRTRHGVRVEISTPRLTQVEIDGSGDVEIAHLNTETFEVDVDGSGDVEFGGEVRELEISVSGSGSVTGLDLVSEYIEVKLRGSGDVELSGFAETVELSLHGSGDVDARRLKADDVGVRVHGSGDVKVHAETDFDGAVYGSGDIDVYGNPGNLVRHVSGSGDITRH